MSENHVNYYVHMICVNNDIYNGRCATFILAAQGSRFDHLVQEVLDGHRSASTTTEAEDYGR